RTPSIEPPEQLDGALAARRLEPEPAALFVPAHPARGEARPLPFGVEQREHAVALDREACGARRLVEGERLRERAPAAVDAGDRVGVAAEGAQPAPVAELRVVAERAGDGEAVHVAAGARGALPLAHDRLVDELEDDDGRTLVGRRGRAPGVGR